MFKLLFITNLLLVSFSSFAISKCQEQWEQLKYIQSMLRYKSTEYWRKREHTAHNDYQDCRKGKKTTNGNKHKNYTKQSYSNNRLPIVVPRYKTFGNPTVTVKGFFQGEMQNAWIKYYKTPKECKKPKSTSQFAKCLAHKRKVADEFNIIWHEKLKEENSKN